MDILGNVRRLTECIETTKEYHGYWYKVCDILTISICGSICGLNNMKIIHEWAISKPVKEMLQKEFGIKKIPCYAQFTNILGIVDPAHLNEIFILWAREMAGKLSDKTVAVDGKTICSTEKMNGCINTLHIISAYVSELGFTIGSMECDTKIGEPKAVQELIPLLDISGAIVVADALNCHKKIAHTVIENGGDYLLSVKDNHPNLHKDIREMFEFKINDICENKTNPLPKYEKVEKGHGRIEQRTAYVIDDINWLNGRKDWERLSCIGAIHTQFQANGNTTSEWHYYISSKNMTAEALATHARREWCVESMHWLLDVHFSEDKTMAHNFNTQRTLNLIRKVVLNLVRAYKTKTGSKKSMISIMRSCLFDSKALIELLAVIHDSNIVSDVLQN